jgi:hypothetical protein
LTSEERRALTTRADTERELFEYIDEFYNTRRIQKRLGWRCPDEYETAYWNGEDLTIPATKRSPTTGMTQAKAAPGSGRRTPTTTPPTAAHPPNGPTPVNKP